MSVSRVLCTVAQLAGIAAIVAGVFLLAPFPVALIITGAAGLAVAIAAEVVEMKADATPSDGRSRTTGPGVE